MENYITIKTLWKAGKSKNAISKATGHDWRTIDKVIKRIKSGKEYPKKIEKKSILDPHKETIVQWIESKLSGSRIHEELLAKEVQISYSSVKRYIKNIKNTNDVFIRVHTEPGKEAQVDFGYFGYTNDNSGKRRKTWVFNMRLSNSRYDYFEKVYNQKVETFIQCHINAFEFFEGIPEYVKIDNLKAAILEASYYEPVYQKLYKSFSEYYNFKPLPCRVRRPNDKGKVESGIKYVKDNFFKGRTFKDGDDLDRQLLNWTNKVNKRIHGTTRKIPEEMFLKYEKEKLKSLPTNAFKMPITGTRKVYHDCHIFFNYNYYSVPFEYVGKEISVEQSNGILKIFYENTNIATHEILEGKGEFATVLSHYPDYKICSDTEYQAKYQIKMRELGKYSEQFFLRKLESSPHSWQGSIRGILKLTKIYPPDVVEMSCKRAVSYNALTYKMVRNICENGAYLLPTEFH